MDIENQGNQKKKANDMVDEDEEKKQNNQMEAEEQQKPPQEPVQDNQERQKQILIETFKLLNDRLSKGCGREKCRNEACIANPHNKHLINDPKQVQLKAVELLKKQLSKVQVCQVPQNVIKSLQKGEVENLLTQQQLEQNFKEVMARIEEVFQDFDAINNSFYIDQNPYQNVEDHTGMIDFKTINFFYDTIIKINDADKKKLIEDVISKGFIRILGDVQKQSDFQKRFTSNDDFRILGCLILYPSLFEDRSLFVKIMNVFYFFNEKQFEMFGYWFKEVDVNILDKLVEMIKTQVMVRYYEEQHNEVEASMNALKILKTSNVILKRIAREKFIVEIFEIDDEGGLNPLEQYKIWLKSKENQDKDKRYFTFCNFPFSMDIKFKYILLEINSKYGQKLEHEKKIKNLINQGQFLINHSQLFTIFEVRREHILEDTLQCVSQSNLNFKLPFKVKFRGEQGIDEGGVRKEYYQIMIKQLFNPDFGLFNEKQFFWFNGNSIDMPMYYELIGSLMGIAIYNQIQMDVRLPNVVYKKLIGEPVSLEDIKQFDLATYNGFKHILNYEGDLESDLQLTFSIEYEYFDQTKIFELKPDGDKITVNQENKKEFIDLYVEWYLNKSIERQFNNFKRGFFKVLSLEIIKLFTFDELVLILTGKEDVDFNELKQNTVYDQGYSANSDQIKWLWEILEEFTLEQKKKFLFFCTGSDRAPVTGFQSQKFIITKHGEELEQLPSAHTCFNHLLLPAYKTKEALKQKLLLSLENAEGFGLY